MITKPLPFVLHLFLRFSRTTAPELIRTPSTLEGLGVVGIIEITATPEVTIAQAEIPTRLIIRVVE